MTAHRRVSVMPLVARAQLAYLAHVAHLLHLVHFVIVRPRARVEEQK